MRKTKLVSVRVPEDILEKLDEMLKNERGVTRSDVICAFLDIATSTLKHWQLASISHCSNYWGNPVIELHIKYRYYGKERDVNFVAESQKSADD